jgi:hypothetical protein
VVNYAAIAGTEFGGSNVGVLLEIQGQNEALEAVVSVGGYVEAVTGLEDEIGLAALPSLREGRNGRLVLRIAFGRAVFSPLADEGDLLGGETPLMLECAETGLGFPGRHEALFGDSRDEQGALGCVLVSEQGKRGDFTGPMALRTLTVEDRRDVLVVCRRRGA